MKWGKQTFFCNACGRRLHATYAQLIGYHWRVCNLACNATMEYRRAASILGQDSDPNAEEDKTP